MVVVVLILLGSEHRDDKDEGDMVMRDRRRGKTLRVADALLLLWWWLPYEADADMDKRRRGRCEEDDDDFCCFHDELGVPKDSLRVKDLLVVVVETGAVYSQPSFTDSPSLL